MTDDSGDLFDLGLAHLRREEPIDGLGAYASGIRSCSTAAGIEAALGALEGLQRTTGEHPGVNWARKLLLLGAACRFGSPWAIAGVRASALAGPIDPPVVIVAGGTHPSVERQMQGYAPLLDEAFARYRGTIVSGGTSQGVGGVTAGIGDTAPGRIHTIGYLPGHVTSGATVDHRYHELRRTSGSGFSPLEPLQYWIDLVGSGVDPATVRVIGVGGGRIAAVEYRVALALGAAVGVVVGSGRAADELPTDAVWGSASRLERLPAHADHIAAFVVGGSGLAGEAPQSPAGTIV
jgi:hypothetical protein